MNLPSVDDFNLGFESQDDDSYPEAKRVNEIMNDGAEHRALILFTAERIKMGHPIMDALAVSFTRCALAGIRAERNRVKRETAS